METPSIRTWVLPGYPLNINNNNNNNNNNNTTATTEMKNKKLKHSDQNSTKNDINFNLLPFYIDSNT